MSMGPTQEQLRIWRETRQPEALGELLKQQRDRAYSIAIRFLHTEGDAEDAVQDAFLKLMSRTHGFENLDDFQLAIYRAVLQCALDTAKRNRRRRAREEPATGLETGVASQMPDLQQQTESGRTELLALLREELWNLSEEERAPVVLCYQQGLTVSDTARVLGLPRETVRARLKRALTRLRAALLRRGAGIGLALLPPLLWRDGGSSAPPSLQARLDAVLPGRKCAELAPLPRPGLPREFAQGGGIQASLALATLAAALLAAGIFGLSRRPTDSLRSASGLTKGTELHEAGRPGSAGTSPLSIQPKTEEEREMKKLLGAAALAGGIFLSSAQAAEPNAEAAKIIQEVQARQAAKAEAKAQSQSQIQNQGFKGPGAAYPGQNQRMPGAGGQ